MGKKVRIANHFPNREYSDDILEARKALGEYITQKLKSVGLTAMDFARRNYSAAGYNAPSSLKASQEIRLL